MDLNTLVRAKREEILRLAADHGAYNIRIFGSVARGEAGPESDLDVLADFAPGSSLFDRIGLMQDLEDLLHCRVDVASEEILHWYVRDRIMREAVAL